MRSTRQIPRIKHRPLPRRVIDVLSSPPRLLPSLGIEDDYTTLSYCWGGPQNLKLTTKNKTDYCHRLLVEKLPQTIKDAIDITRKLQIPYLWIDSMCILQDDEKEKALDIANMGEVYHKCTVTIVGANASTADEGILMPRISEESQIRSPLCLPDFDNKMIPVTLSQLPTPNSYFTNNPIESCGWTLQKRLLSPRMLIYSTTNVRWLCNSLEDYDGGNRKMLGSHSMPHLSTLSSSVKSAQMWQSIVSKFSR